MCITGVLHMFYMCMNYIYNIPKSTTHVLHVHHMCITHEAHLVVYGQVKDPLKSNCINANIIIYTLIL